MCSNNQSNSKYVLRLTVLTLIRFGVQNALENLARATVTLWNGSATLFVHPLICTIINIYLKFIVKCDMNVLYRVQRVPYAYTTDSTPIGAVREFVNGKKE